jgi:superfamily II DNA or RNA helicase
VSSTFAPGSIVQARGRRWVVQPTSAPPEYHLVPLGGSPAEATALHAGLEQLASASFDLPTSSERGDAGACRRMRDAARLATVHAAGPFRSFGRLGFDPRPYQLVPLLLALRLDPVRLLIADDVGIGKTIESLMIARELIDRGEIQGFSVLCPPHLAEQWQRELREKFHLEAELVLSSTTLRLERSLRSASETVFSRYPITVVSLDYVKNERRRREFVQSCPRLVIVDEAHTCTAGGGTIRGRSARQQRHELLAELAKKDGQHILLTTATPHSGDELAYANLLGLLDARFGPGGELAPGLADEGARVKALSAHFVQRRRKDISSYLGDTRFPEREAKDIQYSLSEPMKQAVERVADFLDEYIGEQDRGSRVPRTRRWAMLTLLQAFASSPAAAAATLANRKETEDAGEPAAESDVDLDALDDELLERCTDDFEDSGETSDVELSLPNVENVLAAGAPRSRVTERARRFFREMHEFVAAIAPAQDAKLQALAKFLATQAKDKGGTVVFCRFIATAEHLREQLAQKLGRQAVVECVVGSLPSEDRMQRIERLVEESESSGRARVLVCTDCLSEGINLQYSFDTVVHYDLSWNPNRHVQREGRVDRFGQPQETIRIRQFFSADTLFDAAVLENNRRKREVIARELGYSIPIPISRDALLDSIVELARRNRPVNRTGYLFAQVEAEDRNEALALERETESMLRYERQTRSRFSQHQLSPDLVRAEFERVKDAIGSDSVAAFVREALQGCRVTVQPKGQSERVVIEPDSRREVRAIVEQHLPLRAGERRIVFSAVTSDRPTLLVRSHPLVEALATYVLDSTLDPLAASERGTLPLAARCGVVQTRDVEERTLVVLMRHRLELRLPGSEPGQVRTLLAEDVHSVAWRYDTQGFTRQPDALAQRLVQTVSSGNVEPARASRALEVAMRLLENERPLLDQLAPERAEALHRAHEAVRPPRRAGAQVHPVGKPDILSVYVYLPHASGGSA